VECGLSPEVINARLYALFTVALRKRGMPREAEGGAGKQIQGPHELKQPLVRQGHPVFF
jgi:hypothetical protein